MARADVIAAFSSPYQLWPEWSHAEFALSFSTATVDSTYDDFGTELYGGDWAYSGSGNATWTRWGYPNQDGGEALECGAARLFAYSGVIDKENGADLYPCPPVALDPPVGTFGDHFDGIRVSLGILETPTKGAARAPADGVLVELTLIVVAPHPVGNALLGPAGTYDTGAFPGPGTSREILSPIIPIQIPLASLAGTHSFHGEYSMTTIPPDIDNAGGDWVRTATIDCDVTLS